MKITLFIGGYGPGGAERVFTELCNYLSEKHQITALTWSDRNSYYPLSKNVNQISLKENNSGIKIIDYLQRIKQLKKYLKKNNTDTYIAFLPLATYLLLSMKRLINGLVIFSIRVAPEMEYKSMFMKILASKYIPRADGIIFQTEGQRKFFNKIKIQSYTVIPNSVSSYFKDQKVFVQKEKRIISVGRLSCQKNYELLIKAFWGISEEFPEYNLNIYGEGKERRNLQKLIAEKGLSDRVYLCGVTKNIKEELKKSKLFVMSSDYEGISNALLEAMSVGLPCIATDCDGGGARLLISHMKNGILVPRNDVEKLENAMRLLLKNQSLCHKLSEEAEKVNLQFGPERLLKQWEDYICMVASKTTAKKRK